MTVCFLLVFVSEACPKRLRCVGSPSRALGVTRIICSTATTEQYYPLVMEHIRHLACGIGDFLRFRGSQAQTGQDRCRKVHAGLDELTAELAGGMG